MSIAEAIGRISQIESTFAALAAGGPPQQQTPAPSDPGAEQQFAAALAQATSETSPFALPSASDVGGVDALASTLFRAATAPVSDASSSTVVRPLEGYTVSSDYGPRGAIPEARVGAMFHGGIDLAAPLGTPIRAPFDGTVTYSGWGHPERGNTGWLVVITHADGTETMYNHMKAESPLEVGAVVRAGDEIGEVGSTGNSSGPHLHLSAWVDGEHVNPRDYFAERGIEL